MLVFDHDTAQQVIETALDAVIIIDERNVVHVWNGSAESVFGFSKAEAIGNRLDRLIIPSKLIDAHNAGMARYMATREPKLVGKRVEIVAQRKDGALIDIELALDVIMGTCGTTYFIARCRDVTERREARERNAALVAQIAQANMDLHHWVGNTLQIASASLRLQEPHETRRTIENLAQQYRAKFHVGGNAP